MSRFRHVRSVSTAVAFSALWVFVPLVALAAAPTSPAPAASAHVVDVSMAEYRQHLVSLIPAVEACAKNRDTLHCNAELVGPDNRVPLMEKGQETRRLIRFGWLRVLFAQALIKETPKPAPKQDQKQQAAPPADDESASPSTDDLLSDAVDRLNADIAQVDGKSVAAPPHAAERAALKQVLAGSQFSHLNRRTLRDEMLERFENWLNRLLSRFGSKHATSPWIGRIIFWGFILLVCIGLAWGLMQLERRWRLRLVPESLAPALGAASARDWQLWFADARKSAASGEWREAIHFVYWAVISRLESRRLWPADRARTPREYLALVRPDDARKAGLASLTRSFERTWYGGRAAGEADYRSAEELASTLMGSRTGGTKGGGA